MSAQVRLSEALIINATCPAVSTRSSTRMRDAHSWCSPIARLAARLEQPVPPRRLCTAMIWS